MGYGSLGGMKLGSFGGLPFGHIGGIHAFPLLLAPNPTEGNQMMGSTQDGGWTESNDQSTQLVGIARDNDGSSGPEMPPMPPMPQTPQMQMGQFGYADSGSMLGSPMPRAQIDVMAAGANDQMPMPVPVPTPMLSEDSLVGAYQQQNNGFDENVGAARDEDDDEEDEDGLDAPQVNTIMSIYFQKRIINEYLLFFRTLASIF